jgi:CubicO group peptidase (beta-lactamase class C family)
MVLRVKVPESLIDGDVDEGYGSVADAFRANFRNLDEVGAACAVYRNGRKVVDLWGGYRDGRNLTPWEPDTILLVFSASKGMASAAMAVAHSRGLFDLDEAVAVYWPEFAQNGKDEITVRQLFSHQAGLAILDERLDLARVADTEWLSNVLARQRPGWEPGSGHGYHAVTLGWYQSELVHRVDPQGRRLGQFFAEEVARPLEAKFFIGLPDEVADERVATIHAFAPIEMLLNLDKMPRRMLVSFLNPWGLTSRAMRTLPEIVREDKINSRELLALEVPSVIGIGEPRAMARIYGSLAAGGPELGLLRETLRALEEPAENPSGRLRDLVLKMETSFSLGFVKPFPQHPFGSSSRAYGTPGGGGSFGMADPDAGIGYAYAMNRLGFHTPIDPRELAIREALYTAIGGPSQQPTYGG